MINSDLYIQTVHPDAAIWEQIKDSIIRIEHQTFAQHSYSAQLLEEECTHPSAIVILLRSSKNQEIVGYLSGLTDTDDAESFYLSSVALLEEYRGQGWIGPMTSALETAVHERGYRYLTTDAVIANGYADSIQRHYGQRIVASHEHDSEWGRQRFFKIRL